MSFMVAASLAAAAGFFFARDYVKEGEELAAFLDSRQEYDEGREPMQIIETLTKYIATLPSEETTMRAGYSNPAYRVLKARPLEVLRYGGLCGNKSRLLLALLRIRDIPARLAYLYNEDGWDEPSIGQPYVTAFVEVGVGERWIVADPLLGVVFRNAHGSAATTAELSRDPSLIAQQAPSWYRPSLFDYGQVRGIRWSKFPGGEQVRAALARLTSATWVDGLRYPSWANRPNLVMSVISWSAFPLFIAAGLWCFRWYRSDRALEAFH